MRSASLRASLRRKEKGRVCSLPRTYDTGVRARVARTLSRRDGATLLRPLPGTGPSVFPAYPHSLSSVSIFLEFLVHATIPSEMVGADTKLTKRAFFQRAVKPNVTYFAPLGSLQSLRKNSL
jgi:hypothetical protein